MPKGLKLLRTGVALALLALACLHNAPVRAQTSIDLYEGRVDVTTQDPAERAAVLPQALSQVLVKLSGDAAAVRRPEVQVRLADAQSLMQQFRYQQDVVRVDGSLASRLTLIAGFDPAGVNTLMAETGLSLWPSPRPSPLVWMAIDDGRGARLVSSAQAGVLDPMSSAATRRGLSLQFPLLDDDDHAALTVDDVLQVRVERIVEASRRYPGSVRLLGSLARRGGGWSADWALLDRDEGFDHWSDFGDDAGRLLEAAGDHMADALSTRFATPVLGGTPGTYRVAIEGIVDVHGYARALGYLRSLSVVREVREVAAVDGRLTLELDLGTGIEGLGHLIGLGDVLTVEEPAATGAGSELPIDLRLHLNP